ncbi:RusA-like Holliday junction resolvase [Burkholderia phage BcepNazgul]|uniref:Uncharacterized protein n=1 Tax=Burkholderia phage BcepNazgul TaxID=242861 RepID=Q6UYL9_9CAUD|nr:RusA-like Holliday junction resolvase [Burkholderia phage BcepNazgul]AAQ63322.1 hypothetical protein Nazgul21 [Burkholderia phage BcepNazgul]
MKTFQLNADLVRCAAAWVYGGDPAAMKYPALNRIRIEPHHPGAIIIATCSHAMFVAYDPEAVVPEPALISVPQDLLDAGALLGVNTTEREIRFGDDGVAVYARGKLKHKSRLAIDTHLLRGVKAHYANWRAAIPAKMDFLKANPAIPTMMNMDFLGRLGRMSEGWGEYRQVFFATCGKQSITPGDGQRTDYRNFFAFFPWKRDVFLLFAPMGGMPSAKDFGYPEWLEDKPDDPAAGL